MARVTSHLADATADFLSTVFGRGCYLALQVYLAPTLGPHEFGLYTIAWTVTGLVGTLAPIGMPQAVLRFGVAGRGALRSAPSAIVLLTGAAVFALLLAIVETEQIFEVTNLLHEFYNLTGSLSHHDFLFELSR